MDRRKFRTALFNLMFQMEFHEDGKLEDVIALYESGEVKDDDELGNWKPIKEKDKTALHDRLLDLVSKRGEIDAIIEQYSNGWKLERIGKAELTILRVGVYEIVFDEEVPNAVAINEAVELAKAYTDDKAPGFINGILGQVVKNKKVKEDPASDQN